MLPVIKKAQYIFNPYKISGTVLCYCMFSILRSNGIIACFIFYLKGTNFFNYQKH